MATTLGFAFGLPGGMEWIIILVVALLIFGKRLPDVARSVGSSVVEFKKGLNTAKEEADDLGREIDRAADGQDPPKLS